jgi:hypothetical protein
MVVKSRARVGHLIEHLQRHMFVRRPDGEPTFLRLYDPRVLPPLLAASDAAWIDEMLYILDWIAVPDLDGPSLLYYRSG